MKRLLLPLLLILATAAAAQTLQTQRKTMIFHHAEDWCGSCGTWGWAIMDSMMRIEKTVPSSKAYNLSVYFNSTQAVYNSPISLAIGDNALPNPVFAIPTITVDNNTSPEQDVFDDFDWTSDPDSIGDLVDPAIDSLIAYVSKETAPANAPAVGFYKTIKNTDSLIINTRVKFPAAVSGTFRVAVYVAEDSIYGYQEDDMGGFNAYHRMVLKDAVQYGVWGQVITGVGAAANQEFFHSFRMKMPATWNKSRLSYFVIVYRKVSATHYEVENVTKTYGTAPNSVAAVNEAADIDIYPNPAREKLYVKGAGTAASVGCTLSDMSGRNIPVEVVRSSTGHQFLLEVRLPQGLAKAAYLLTVQNGEATIIREVMVD